MRSRVTPNSLSARRARTGQHPRDCSSLLRRGRSTGASGWCELLRPLGLARTLRYVPPRCLAPRIASRAGQAKNGPKATGCRTTSAALLLSPTRHTARIGVNGDCVRANRGRCGEPVTSTVPVCLVADLGTFQVGCQALSPVVVPECGWRSGSMKPRDRWAFVRLHTHSPTLRAPYLR